MAARDYGQCGGVASALELVGERWALLIVRDLLVGPRRYSDLKAGLPRIPTNILSSRLKELQAGGVVRRVPTVRGGYELTPYGRELDDIVLALERWGSKAVPQSCGEVTSAALTVALRAAFDSQAALALPAACYLVRAGEAAVAVRVVDGGLRVWPVDAALPAPDAAEREAALLAVDVELVAEDWPVGALAPERASSRAGLRHAWRAIRGDALAVERFATAFPSWRTLAGG